MKHSTISTFAEWEVRRKNTEVIVLDFQMEGCTKEVLFVNTNGVKMSKNQSVNGKS